MKVVLAVCVPEVPVMVTVDEPTVAELLAVTVISVSPGVVGFGEKDAVTPLGSPEATRFTLPENPY